MKSLTERAEIAARMLAAGNDVEDIAEHIGVSVGTLGRNLRRVGRGDLSRPFERADSQTRRDAGTKAVTTHIRSAYNPLIPAREQGWMRKGLCVGSSSPDDWFPNENKKNLTPANLEAQRICGECPVRTTCATYAIENDEPAGIYGGLTPDQRKRLKEKAA